MAYSNLTGTPSIPSLSGYATESYVGTQISNLVDSSPAALNTLNELAAAIGDDANFSTTVTNNIATKQTSTTFTTNNVLSGRGTTSQDTVGDGRGVTFNYSGTSGNKPTGTDHSLMTMAYSSAWQTQFAQDWRNGGRSYIRGQNNGTWSSWSRLWSSDDFANNSSNWDTAYGWGNHASAGYITDGNTNWNNTYGFITSSDSSITSKLPKAGGTMTGKLTTNTGIEIFYNDHASGAVWDTFVHIGKVDDASNHGNVGPVYQPDGSYGMLAQANSDGMFVGLEETTSGNYNPVIKWGDDHTSGEDLFFRHADDTLVARMSYNSFTVDGTISATGGNSGNWNTAYGWGNHASAGYITDGNTNWNNTYGFITSSDSSITNKLPIAGGTITGGLTISGSVDPAGTDYGFYQSAGTNLILKGDSSGRSGIFFESEKNGTNINDPSDYGFIQYHPYGYGGTSGESGDFVIGVSNDSTDHVILQSPYSGGVKVGYKNATSGTGLTLQTVFHDAYHPNADKWTTARSHTVTLTGEVTGTATQSVDGTGNKTWSIATSMNNSSLDDNYVQILPRHNADGDSLVVQSRASITIWDVSGASDDPSGASDGLVLSAGWDSSSWGIQQFHDFHSNDLYLRAKNNGSMTSWDRVFHDTYHPNADTLTTARTIAGTSFNGSANIDINYNNLTNKPTIPTNNNQLTNGAAYLTASNDRIYITDTRNASRPPSYYDDRYVQADFSQSTNFGVSGGDTWGTALTISKWASYHSSHRQEQLIFTGTKFARRVATSDSGWSSAHTIWDSSTDGSGSGLDADLLDGQQGSHYLNYNNFSNTPSIPTNNNQLTNGAGYLSSVPNISAGIITSGTIGAARLPGPLNSLQSNAVTGSAFATTGSPSSVLEYQQATGQTDTKLAPSTDWHNTIRMGHGNPYSYYSNTIAMRMTGTNDGTMFTQHIHNNTAQGWRQQWDSGNDGSGSGLDADLLDGQHGSHYLNYNNFSNTPSIPSLSGYATESYVGTQISNLVDSSPAALNTLNELAAAIGDDANFSTTVTNNIATKLPKSGGTMTGTLNLPRVRNGTAGALYLGNYNTSNTDQWPLVRFVNGTDGTTGTWDDGFIKGSSARGRFSKAHMGIHFDDDRSFAFHTSGWDTEMEINGDGRIYQKGPVGINTTPSTSGAALQVEGTINSGAITSTGNIVAEDSEVHVGNTTGDNWTRIKHAQADGYGFDFQHDNATVIVNEQGSTNQVMVLGDVDAANYSGLFGVAHTTNSGTAWTKKLDLRGNGDLYIGASGTSRVFHDGYHPNADILTTARTIAGTSFNGSANIDISYNNLTNKPTIPTNNNQLTNGAGYLTSSSTQSKYLRSDTQDLYTPTRIDFGSTGNWDAVGFGNLTNIHVQNHNQFWFGAGNGTWFTGTANSKSSASGLAADADKAHDLLITTMIGTSTYDRGITFGVDSGGAGNSGYRLGKWHSSNEQHSSKLTIDGGLHVRGGDTLNYDYYANDYSGKWDSNSGGAYWTGDSNWIDPSITAGNALQIQAGNSATNSNNPALQFHQYGYGGVQMRYDGPNDVMHLESTGSNRYDYFQNTTDHGYIQLGPMNGSYAHIYTNIGGGFYFNKTALYADGNTMWHAGNDGSGSGLDADTLDGVESGSFLRSNETDTASGSINFTNDDYYFGSRLRHYGDTNTYMQFHAADQWRVVAAGAERLEANTNAVKVSNGPLLIPDAEYIGAHTSTKGRIEFEASMDGGVKLLVGSSELAEFASNSGPMRLTFQPTLGEHMFIRHENTNTNICEIGFHFDNDGTQTESQRFISDGTIHADGDVIAYSTSLSSDIRLKENVRPLEGSLDKVLNLRGVQFDWKEEKRPNDQLGFIAQEVEEVLPEIVKETVTLSEEGKTHKTVNYEAVIPVLVEAIKEQQEEINKLTDRINDLEIKENKNGNNI
jgi:hypothetical protein